jgi:hypothetical protein
MRPSFAPRHPAAAQQRAPRFAAPSRPARHIAAPRGRPSFTARAERRELRRLQRQPHLASPRTNSMSANQAQSRLDQLQSRRGRLSRVERNELRQLRRDERATQNVQRDQTRLQQLQQQANQNRLNRADRRELRRLERAQQQQNPIAGAPVGQQPSAARAQRVTPQQVSSGRFASNFLTDPRRSDRRASRLAGPAAWRLGLAAAFVPWYGPIYWPYAYDDIFYTTFWPDAYEPGYWAYAYDDFFDGIFFPDGAPYLAYAYAGPYRTTSARETTGSAHARGTPGRLSQEARNFCADQAKGVAAWPFERIERAVQPNDEQRNLLDALKKAAADAAAGFRDACPDAVPLTPPGRLQAITARLEATLGAVTTVRPALLAFYDSLSDEQKARFNEIGPELNRWPARAHAAQQQANCSGQKAGISGLAIDRIEAIVQPTDRQQAALDRLDDAIQKAVDTLGKACPTATAMTPIGRLDAMQKRIEAMIAAANEVRPALETFYAALNAEQKAKFNRLGRDTAQSGN